MSNHSHHSWSDDLTTENSRSFVRRLRSMLAGNRYTFIATSSDRSRVEVRVNQYLKASYATKIGLPENIRLKFYPAENGLRKRHSITIGDTYGVAFLSAYERKHKTAKHAWFEFTSGSRHAGTGVTIQHYADSGALLTWKFIVQGPLANDGNKFTDEDFIPKRRTHR